MTQIRVTSDRSAAPALELVDVVKRFGAGATEVRALTDVSLTVAPSELVAVMGPSGCGKSTLLHLAGGLEDATPGQVRVGGLDVGAMSPSRRAALRRTDVGYVFQRLNLVVTLTALENVMCPSSWRACAPATPGSGRARRSPRSASTSTSTASPTTSRVASSSASRSPGRSPASGHRCLRVTALRAAMDGYNCLRRVLAVLRAVAALSDAGSRWA